MENKSLNIFNSRLVLATPDTATDGDFARIEGAWLMFNLRSSQFAIIAMSRCLRSQPSRCQIEVPGALPTPFVNPAGVVGHEYFHNWTGNRVTCRDWFQVRRGSTHTLC